MRVLQQEPVSFQAATKTQQNVDWDESWGSIIGLNCHEAIALFETYNLKRNFQTKYANWRNYLSQPEVQIKTADLAKVWPL